MNQFIAIQTHYLRPSRTIETVVVTYQQRQAVFFIYNHEGTSYRIFRDPMQLVAFFNDQYETDIHFETEEDVDAFLGNVPVY